MVDDNIFACTFENCLKSYSKRARLEEHLRSHTGERPYKCDFEGCQKSFLRKGHLKDHLLIHKTEKSFSCDKCEKKFTLKHQLQRHQKYHEVKSYPVESVLTFKCSLCNEKFNRKNNLTKHLKGHEKAGKKIEKVYLCGICSTSFVKWSEFLTHTKSHESEYRCEICQKSFQRAKNLLLHRKVHNENSKIPCQKCDKLLSSKSALALHVKTVHLDLRPYECEKCKKSFGHKHLLVRHRRLHDKNPKEAETEPINEAQLKPENTDDMAKEISGMEYELERDIPCPHLNCNFRFNRDYDLKRHITAYHKS